LSSISIEEDPVTGPADDDGHRFVPTVAQLGALAATMGMTLTELLVQIVTQFT
jgi:hypothetical protein